MFINTLEGSVVGHGAVGKRKPLSVSDALLGILTAHHLSGEKELLNLLLGQGRLVRSNGEESASQIHHRDKNQTPAQIRWIHGRSSTELVGLYSFAPQWTTTTLAMSPIHAHQRALGMASVYILQELRGLGGG